ncbi:spore maturation protein cgeB [Paenibacillus pectinilyticus]|uniref:Spore maturation protein cgeB n=1 Tax=Paenibacillus pectinilyticus TaxID=512399 RepID=A0A1C1A0Q4_9BACL|nr:glycosyltransferase [Paenibacillus pectinilyticus]OCT14001.1 spore maturation protein cgeB [Paenibacillus pectinilyticus]
MEFRNTVHARGQGHADGYQAGYSSGVRLGLCEAIMQKAVRDRAPSPVWNVRVLYITSGKGFPYGPLDIAIIEALRPLVRELIIGNSDKDAVHIGNPTATIETLAARHRPDLMIVLDGMNLALDVVDRVRRMGIRTAVWLTDDPYYTDLTASYAPHYDFMFTLEINCVQLYREMGCAQVHYLPLAFQPEMFRPKNVPVGMQRDISFIGSAYWNRVALFDQIAPYLATKRVFISGIWWERLRQYKLLAPQIQLNTWMTPEQTANAYNGAKIVINMHRAFDDQSYNNNSRRIQGASPNPRTFEISGCGVLQLTDIRSDLVNFYTPGYDIVTYSSPEELVHLMNHYLIHEEERKQIALRGLYRTMRDHTYTNRLITMLSIVFGPR